MSKLITKETLEKWGACSDGKAFFLDKFPSGAMLKDGSKYLIAEGRVNWSNWLWKNCAQDDEYVDQTVIAAGNDGTATAGDRGTATAGDWGTATAGHWGTASAGDYGTASAGYLGTASAGFRGTASVDDEGTASAGYRGTATAGDCGTATAGYRGTAMAGNNGMLILKHWTGSRYVVRSANVCEEGIEPNVPYKLNEDGTKFVRADGGVK